MTTAFGGTGLVQRAPRWFSVAATRTGSEASAAVAAPTRAGAESWTVLGAMTTSGSSPAGSSTSGCGSSNRIGPVTWTCGGQSRGYSSWGKVATRASSSLIGP